MNPGPELDRRVCEIVGIPTQYSYLLLDGRHTVDHIPAVSTSLAACEPVIEWLRKKDIHLGIESSPTGWYVEFHRITVADHEPCETLPHAICEAVLSVAECKP